MFRLFCFLIGYAFGCIPTAYIVGKAHGIDIRKHGSGNAGTTNSLRVLGKRAAGIVLAGDLAKVFAAILVTCLIFKKANPDMYYLIKIYTAAGVVLGHDYPFFLGFKGGKGIACFGGMVLCFFPPLIPACVVTFFGTFFLTHYVSLASIMLLFTFFSEVIIFGQNGFLGMDPSALYELYGIVVFLVALAIFQHRKNIVRLVKGEERRTYIKKKSDENIQGKTAVTASEEETVNNEVVEDKVENTENEQAVTTDHSFDELVETIDNKNKDNTLMPEFLKDNNE